MGTLEESKNRKQHKQPPGGCSVKEIFLRILQNSQGNNCVGVYF